MRLKGCIRKFGVLVTFYDILNLWNLFLLTFFFIQSKNRKFSGVACMRCILFRNFFYGSLMLKYYRRTKNEDEIPSS
jgi:hypothetical protein